MQCPGIDSAYIAVNCINGFGILRVKRSIKIDVAVDPVPQVWVTDPYTVHIDIINNSVQLINGRVVKIPYKGC
jgi:hypothetical protein